MSCLQRSLKHSKALVQAFRRPSHVRCFKAPPVVVERGQTVLKDPQSFLASSRNRWTTTMSLIPRAASHYPPFDQYSASAFSSAATPEMEGKDSTSSPSTDSAKATPAEESAEPVQPTSEEQKPAETQQVAQEEVNREDLVGLLGEKLALIEEKDKEVKTLKDKLLWSLAEMENVRARTKRDAENTRKFAVQSFAKGLLDVADNLSRATGAVPESLAKANPADDSSGNIKVLQNLLQGVEMTERQLLQVFKKNGLEKYGSLGEPFDPDRHSAVFEVQDATKPAGTVAMELKAGYLLNDRVIRPAEVAVVKEE